MKEIPFHLKKYIIDQNETQYTAIDHSVWRYILRQLKSFLKVHGHPSYIDGLEKTGIELEKIPQISEISKKIEKFGWTAAPVSGFLPPAVFMELQSLKILPIATDMRTLDHLTYTPAPDIVHEAAGHAPLLADPEYTQYLTEYAQVAKKAIISSEDLTIYEAIRKLSDIKELPGATQTEIDQAQAELEKATQEITFVSEAAQLARMNWWTAEYGLIGDLKNPKIFGAGLLSSVGEAKECLNPIVKKIPLTLDCIEQSYDITEPQPQLFVTPSFAHLSEILQQMSAQMAFKTGGLSGVKKAIQSKTVNTAQLSSHLQVSGLIDQFLTDSEGGLSFLKTTGPTQLAVDDHQLPGHSIESHPHGFSSPIGTWKGFESRCPSALSESELKTLKLVPGEICELHFTNGFKVRGKLLGLIRSAGKIIFLQWTEAEVSLKGKIYYQPDWGPFDQAVGASVFSVFAGPADRARFGQAEDFVVAKVPAKPKSEVQNELNAIYLNLRNLRQSPTSPQKSEELLQKTYEQLQKFPQDWLASVEALEILSSLPQPNPTLLKNYLQKLQSQIKQKPNLKTPILDGLALIQNPKISLDAASLP